MTSLNTLEAQASNEILAEEAFSEIVDSIKHAEEELLTPLEKAELQQESVGKPAGYADQGYRHG